MRGIINIIIGGILLVGGLSGQMVFIGTSQSWPLVAIGMVLIGLGGYRLITSFNRE